MGSLPPSDDDLPAESAKRTDDLLNDMPLLTNEQDSVNLSHDINLDTNKSVEPRNSHIVIPGGYTADQKQILKANRMSIDVKNGMESLNNGDFEPMGKHNRGFTNAGINFGQNEINHDL